MHMTNSLLKGIGKLSNVKWWHFLCCEKQCGPN